ncbi:MAG: hypothetical protein KGZ85_07890 [Ignavibacterium sp.]|nr:hypothetical protein [Ignavibacterium sp.]
MVRNQVERPYIRLQGEWLNEAGFGIGSLFVAEITDNQIILTRRDAE